MQPFLFVWNLNPGFKVADPDAVISVYRQIRLLDTIMDSVSTGVLVVVKEFTLRAFFGIHAVVLRRVRGGFFLRKKPLGCVVSVCLNPENA